VNPLRFRLWISEREEQFAIPADYVESVLLPSAEHEAGHVIAAHHLNARVLGIAIGFAPDEKQMFLQTLYQWKDSTVEDKCVVKAAGPAADILFNGGPDEQSARRDLQDIENLTGRASLEPFLGTAKSILAGYASEFRCITKAFRNALGLEEERSLGVLPGGDFGALLLDDGQLLKCLSSP